MKGISTVIILSIFLTLFITIMPTEREGEIYEDTIRLHILANSDDECDQEMKLRVRDFILDAGLLSGVGESKEAAEASLASGTREAEEKINEDLRAMGVEYEARVTLTEEWYDTRDYEGFSLPKGVYTSYRVILGAGDGQNWWCVMYPPICKGLSTDNASDDAISYSGEEIALISSGKYRIKFKILEVLSQRLKK